MATLHATLPWLCLLAAFSLVKTLAGGAWRGRSTRVPIQQESKPTLCAREATDSACWAQMVRLGRDVRPFGIAAVRLTVLAVIGLASPFCDAQEIGEWELLDEVESRRVLDDLPAQWRGQREGIFTAHLKYRLIESSTRPLSREEFADLLDAADLLSHPENLKMVSDRARRELEPGEFLAYDWGEMELWQEGTRVREQNNAKGAFSASIRDGETRIDYLSKVGVKGQATVANTGSRAVMGIADITYYRFIPLDLPAESVNSIKRKDGLLLLRCSGPTGYRSDLTIEASTGMVLRQVSFDPEGQVRSERVQEGFTTYPDGIMFPTLYVEARYKDEKLRRLVLCLLEDAVFNESIPDETFAVAVPSDTVVVDDRQSPRKVTKLDEPTDDLLGLPDTGIPPASPPARERISWSGWLLALGVPLLLIVILAVAMRRKQPRSDR
ncbi:MAG: hypothetical protein HQ582_32875 [Planctomycetes bacterium]|nr:hypothetical protein [Planctomycetota bacterium]